MDFSESTKVVFQRIKELDPANAIKIIGYLLLEGHDEHGMIRLVYSPDNVIQSLIDRTKQELALLSKTTLSINDKAPQAKNSFGSTLPTKFTPFTPAYSHFPLSCPDKGQVDPQFHLEQPLIHNTQYVPMPNCDSSSGGYGFHNQPHFLPLEDPKAKNYHPGFPWHLNPNQIYPNCPEIFAKLCEHFSQGYCRYGASCKFLHVLHMENGNVMVLNSPNANEDHVSIGSLGFIQQLEMELIDLLRPRRGVPVPITSLPVLYYEKYGKMLQAEGYFMESYIKGKVGFNLTHLLAQMSKNIRLIDRPHGQQCVILREHIPMYMRFVEERKEHETSFASLCQIYLTFPPHSILSEQDVHNYFNNFGPVQDVRIPKQDKRMFAFVTFLYPETVTLVLKTGNPHFISDARVLVKPYRDKPTFVDRKLEENAHLPMCSSSSSPAAEYKLLTKAKSCMFPAKQQLVIEELEQTVDGSSLPQVLSNGCITEDNIGLIRTCSTDEKSLGEINLPDSPFACDMAIYSIPSDSSETKKDLEL